MQGMEESYQRRACCLNPTALLPQSSKEYEPRGHLPVLRSTMRSYEVEKGSRWDPAGSSTFFMATEFDTRTTIVISSSVIPCSILISLDNFQRPASDRLHYQVKTR